MEELPMPTSDAIQLLRRHDPAGLLEPVPRELREKLRDDLLGSAAQVTPARSTRVRSRKPLQLVAAVALALVVGVGVAWASGALSPLAVFEDSVQQRGAAPGSL